MTKRKRKPVRERGKIRLSQYFQKLLPGDRVCLYYNPQFPAGFPKRYIGRTAVVEGKQGRAYIVKLKDGSKEKRFVVMPIHLKKLK